MPFIGIISDEKSENYIRRELLNNLQINESNVLFIKEKSIENIKNIKFETVLLARQFKNIDVLKKILANTKYLIINTDIKNNLNLLEDLQLTVITYGFNSKATVTVSSVTDDKILLCLQRNIIDRNGKVLEAQEIQVVSKKLEDNNIDVLEVMGTSIILLIYGKII